MSHLRERKEKNCLNCGTQVHGRFCHHCGQENIEPKESAWHLVSHFFQDITHFDGKFFSTVKLLVIRPGFLSRQYILGRRASFLNPIRMYIFTSAFFFLLFFTFFSPGKNSVSNDFTFNKKTLKAISEMDSAQFADFTREINLSENKRDVPMTRTEFKKYTEDVFNNFQVFPTKYKTKEMYDSALRAGKDHGWFSRKLTYKMISVNEKYKSNNSGAMVSMQDRILHSIPQMLFISLPLLALMLKLLYIRRKEFYYVSHGIFSIHLYIFTFITLLVTLCLGTINDYLNWTFISIVEGILFLLLFFYMYKAMRHFYQQGRGKTILKFILINIMMLIMMVILFGIFALYTLFNL